jgi:hypothetical protein
MRRIVAFAILSLLVSPVFASAQTDEQRFEAAVHVTSVYSDQYDTDIGVGGRFAFYPTRWIGADASLSIYPHDLSPKRGNTLVISRGRVEGLFGATVGPQLGRLRPFGYARPGFLHYQAATEPFACITIFPPPLACTLAAGTTVFAFDVGGGVDIYPTTRTVVRLDAGDRMVRYPGPSLDVDGTAHDASFYGHDFRISVDAGLRF